MAKKSLGTKLRQIREENKLSQEDVAAKMEMSQKTISSWETDRTHPKLRELLALCDIYGCTYEYLTGTKQYDSNDIALEDIMLKLSTLDVDELMKIGDHIKVLIKQHEERENIEKEKARLEKEKEELEKKLSNYNRMLALMEVNGVRRE